MHARWPESWRQKADFDIVFIDLPGSMDISGVLQTIFNVDYVLTPIAADNFVMDSSFVFAKKRHEVFGKTGRIFL